MKLNTKFNYGDKVKLPFTDRLAKIESLKAYGEHNYKYKLSLSFPLAEEDKFKTIYFELEENYLTATK